MSCETSHGLHLDGEKCHMELRLESIPLPSIFSMVAHKKMYYFLKNILQVTLILVYRHVYTDMLMRIAHAIIGVRKPMCVHLQGLQ